MFKVEDKDIEKLILVEYENAVEQYGKTYNSDFEFIAVLKEEMEEVEACGDSFHNDMAWIWQFIKANKNINNNLDGLENHLKDNIKESLQCLAVIRKYKNK